MSTIHLTGEIILWGGNTAPTNYAFCDGQSLTAVGNSALFSIIGTNFGGDGNNFNLPDLRGRVPIHEGSGPGLTPRAMGSTGGTEEVTLNISEIPAHNHALQAKTTSPNNNNPTSNFLARSPIYSSGTSDVSLNSASISSVGGSQPHENMQPFLTVNFLICTLGVPHSGG